MRAVIYWLSLSLAATAAFAGTPRQALLELATTRDPAVLVKHLPLVLIQHIDRMSPSSQKEFLERFTVTRHFEEQKIKLVPSDDEQTLFFVGTSDWDSGYAFVRREIINGAEAMEEVAFCTKGDSGTCRSSMMFLKLQEGEWRLSEIAGGFGRGGANFEDPNYLAGLDAAPANANESSAVGTLRTYNTSIIAYETSFPEQGVPNSAADLGSRDGQQEPTPDHAMLVDNALACSESLCIKSGYSLQYHRVSNDEYFITARPVTYGETGTRSFYTDASGVIRATSENREPTAKDGPI
jgi:hypothetical protein